MTYAEKLKDPRWQKKRLEVLQRDSFQCRECGNKEIELQVHHLYYVSGRAPWQYPTNSLHTLCLKCHTKIRNGEMDWQRNGDGLREWEVALDSLSDWGDMDGGFDLVCDINSAATALNISHKDVLEEVQNILQRTYRQCKKDHKSPLDPQYSKEKTEENTHTQKQVVQDCPGHVQD